MTGDVALKRRRDSAFGLVFSPDCTADTVEAAFALCDRHHGFKLNVIVTSGHFIDPASK